MGAAPRKIELESRGYLQDAISNGVLFVRLRAPDNVSPATLLSDSKQFMDLILKAYPFVRPVGSDPVRVTSLGKATEELWFTDTYGRKWQLRRWLVPFSDTNFITAALPTPDGMIMMLGQTPSGLHAAVAKVVQDLCDYVYVSYTGTLAQWRVFLDNTSILPLAVARTTIQFNYAKGFAVRSSRFEMLVPLDIIKVAADSELMLKYSFMREGSGATWDLGGVYLADGPLKQRWIGALRRVKPPPSMPEDAVLMWQKLSTGVHPWDGTPFMTSAGRSEVDGMSTKKGVSAGVAQVGYTMTLSCEGSQPVKKMKNEFSALQRGLSVFE